MKLRNALAAAAALPYALKTGSLKAENQSQKK